MEPLQPVPPVLISTCLLGRNCRFDGHTKGDPALVSRLEASGVQLIPYCPEESGGLPTPRSPAWIEAQDAEAVWAGRDRVLDEAGEDVTSAFVRGAEGALALCKRLGIRTAYLKERSPSCGVCQTHAHGELIDGPGVTTVLLQKHGIETLPG